MIQPPQPQQQLVQIQSQLQTLSQKCVGILTACDEFLKLVAVTVATGPLTEDPFTTAPSSASSSSGILSLYHILLLKVTQLLEAMDKMSLEPASTGSGSRIPTIPLESILVTPHKVYPEDPEFIPRALLISKPIPEVKAEQEDLSRNAQKSLQSTGQDEMELLDLYHESLLDALDLLQEGRAELEELWRMEANQKAELVTKEPPVTTSRSGTISARDWSKGKSGQQQGGPSPQLAATLSFLRFGPV